LKDPIAGGKCVFFHRDIIYHDRKIANLR
jgi:hypothetical protein